eukprot:2256_1
MDTSIRIATVGDSYVDIQTGNMCRIPKFGEDTVVDSVRLLCGGSAANMARHLGGLGVSSRLFSPIGDDEFGKFFHRKLAEENSAKIDGSVVTLPGVAMSTCICLSGCDDRAFVSCNPTLKTFKVSHIDVDLLTESNHVHFAGYFGCTGLQTDDLVSLLKSFRDRGITSSLDTQFDAEGKWTGRNDNLRKILPLIDVFMPNYVEACAITNTKIKEDAMLELRKRSPNALIVIRCGAEGVIYTRAKQTDIQSVPAFFISVLDTTGAGDAFNAAFLEAYVRAGGRNCSDADIRTALRRGCAGGALCVTRHGACEKPLRSVEIDELVRAEINIDNKNK